MQFLDREALTSRIDRLESLLLSVMSNNTDHSSSTTSNDILQFSNVSEGSNNSPGNQIAQIEPGNGKESVDMELLGKEFGCMKVEPTQTFYHGGQHWVSIMFQV